MKQKNTILLEGSLVWFEWLKGLGFNMKKNHLKMKSTPTIFNNFELLCYLMDCIPLWIQILFQSSQNENESRPHCLKRLGLEELKYHNTFPSWAMNLNHHHKWSRNHSWKNTYFGFLIWQLQRTVTYPQLECASTSKDRKLISIVCPNCTWISQVKSRLLS